MLRTFFKVLLAATFTLPFSAGCGSSSDSAPAESNGNLAQGESVVAKYADHFASTSDPSVSTFNHWDVLLVSSQGQEYLVAQAFRNGP
jgi:hypothetical protein